MKPTVSTVSSALAYQWQWMRGERKQSNCTLEEEEQEEFDNHLTIFHRESHWPVLKSSQGRSGQERKGQIKVQLEVTHTHARTHARTHTHTHQCCTVLSFTKKGCNPFRIGNSSVTAWRARSIKGAIWVLYICFGTLNTLYSHWLLKNIPYKCLISYISSAPSLSCLPKKVTGVTAFLLFESQITSLRQRQVTEAKGRKAAQGSRLRLNSMNPGCEADLGSNTIWNMSNTLSTPSWSVRWAGWADGLWLLYWYYCGRQAQWSLAKVF
jgi:hypothetical protein